MTTTTNIKKQEEKISEYRSHIDRIKNPKSKIDKSHAENLGRRSLYIIELYEKFISECEAKIEKLKS